MDWMTIFLVWLAINFVLSLFRGLTAAIIGGLGGIPVVGIVLYWLAFLFFIPEMLFGLILDRIFRR